MNELEIKRTYEIGKIYEASSEINYAPIEDLDDEQQKAFQKYVNNEGDVVFPVGTKMKYHGPIGGADVWFIDGVEVDLIV